MQTLPSRPMDGPWVAVTLRPMLAKEVARVLRIQLACELERPFEEPLPSREDAGRLRTVLDLCVDQLETLAWGAPSNDVRMTAPRFMLEAIARDLLDGATELLANPRDWKSSEAQSLRRQRRRMVRAAEAINAALASEPQYQLAS